MESPHLTTTNEEEDQDSDKILILHDPMAIRQQLNLLDTCSRPPTSEEADY